MRVCHLAFLLSAFLLLRLTPTHGVRCFAMTDECVGTRGVRDDHREDKKRTHFRFRHAPFLSVCSRACLVATLLAPSSR